MAQKKQKYDRQLRIWGEHGQDALEHANVCLLNCGPTGTETLKNLVLGGIGSFTIVDGSKVEAEDLGNNYLLDHQSLGHSRAKCASALLQELNESVGGSFVEESPEAILESNPSFFSGFTIIVATQVSESTLVKLDEICRKANVILLAVRSYGLAGYLRISVKEHCVVEAKVDNPVDDLRIHKPWKELERFVSEVDIDTQDDVYHKHIPYAVILVKLMHEWKSAHAGELPKSSQERSEFKASIKARKRVEDEDNYKEAMSAAYKAWTPITIGRDLQMVLDDAAAQELDGNSSSFWILVAALREFIAENGGDLPLDGSIPDMHSYTELYVRLQTVYQQKADADVSAVEEQVKKILKRLGRDAGAISRTVIKTFCKNAKYLKVLRYPSLAEEYGPRSGPELHRLLTREDNSNAALYILIRAADHFAATYNRFPGEFDSELEEDLSRLKSVCASLLSEANVSGGVNVPDDYAAEVCRFGAGELHTVAAVMGGIAAQEAIKLITKQFVPLSGPLIYNGIASTTSMFNL